MPYPKTTNVKAKNYPPWKADWYSVGFEDFEEKEDKNNDTYTLVSFSFGDNDSPITVYLGHKEDDLWKGKQFKAAIGMNDEEQDFTPYKGTRLLVWIQNRLVPSKDDPSVKLNFPDIRKFKPYDGMAKPEPTTGQKPDGDDPF